MSMSGAATARTPKEKSFNAFRSVALDSGSKQVPSYMAPTIGAVVKKKEELETGRVDIKEHLRGGDRVNSKNRSISNGSMRRLSRTLNQSQSLGQWRPTSIRDKSLDKSFATPLASREPTGWVALGDSTKSPASTSMTRSSEQALINRLFVEGQQKKALKK